MMKQEEITKKYEMFNIPENEMPIYTNPYDFALGFKKFTLVQDVNITYSNTSVPSAVLHKQGVTS